MEIAAPRYPIYVISKGRADSRLTIRALEIAGVEHQVVIEPQEFDAYAKHVPPHRIRVLPFSNLGQGSIPARNWVWEDAIAAGATRHWILDDNIRCFYRLHENRKVYFQSGQFFSLMENFADAYTNLGLVGPNYSMMAPRKETRLNPYKLNTRIYSCILIRNDLPFRWRGRYNEDTDLSLRVLKAGYCTALFNALLACKIGTMSMKGGNTEELYRGAGRLQMALHLVAQHPDVTKVTWRWGRWQHYVDYRQFENQPLIPNPEFKLEDHPVRLTLVPRTGMKTAKQAVPTPDKAPSR